VEYFKTQASLHKAKFIGLKYLNLIKASWGKSGQFRHKKVLSRRKQLLALGCEEPFLGLSFLLRLNFTLLFPLPFPP